MSLAVSPSSLRGRSRGRAAARRSRSRSGTGPGGSRSRIGARSTSPHSLRLSRTTLAPATSRSTPWRALSAEAISSIPSAGRRTSQGARFVPLQTASSRPIRCACCARSGSRTSSASAATTAPRNSSGGMRHLLRGPQVSGSSASSNACRGLASAVSQSSGLLDALGGSDRLFDRIDTGRLTRLPARVRIRRAALPASDLAQPRPLRAYAASAPSLRPMSPRGRSTASGVATEPWATRRACVSRAGRAPSGDRGSARARSRRHRCFAATSSACRQAPRSGDC